MKTQTKFVVGAALAALMLIAVIASSTARAGIASAQTGAPADQVGGWVRNSDTAGEGWNGSPWYARMVHTWGSMMEQWMGQAQMFGQRMTHGWMNSGNLSVGCGQATAAGQNGRAGTPDCRSSGMMGR